MAFVVSIDKGCYSDRQTWPVRVLDTADRASEYIRWATALINAAQTGLMALQEAQPRHSWGRPLDELLRIQEAHANAGKAITATLPEELGLGCYYYDLSEITMDAVEVPDGYWVPT